MALFIGASSCRPLICSEESFQARQREMALLAVASFLPCLSRKKLPRFMRHSQLLPLLPPVFGATSPQGRETKKKEKVVIILMEMMVMNCCLSSYTPITSVRDPSGHTVEGLSPLYCGARSGLATRPTKAIR